MPFKSKAQQRYMFSQHPRIARRWADAMEDNHKSLKSLPEKKAEDEAGRLELLMRRLKERVDEAGGALELKPSEKLRKQAALYQLTKEGSGTPVPKTLFRFSPAMFSAIAGPPLLYAAYRLMKPKPRKKAVNLSSSESDVSFAPLPGTGIPSEPL